MLGCSEWPLLTNGSREEGDPAAGLRRGRFPRTWRAPPHWRAGCRSEARGAQARPSRATFRVSGTSMGTGTSSARRHP